jgi:predicted AAA+ superfamily ATPase
MRTTALDTGSDEMNSQFSEFLLRAEQFMERVEASMPHSLQPPDWDASIAFRYRKSRSGQGYIEPVRHVGTMHFDSLKEIETQKKKINLNTVKFVDGLPANNVLLTGARGTGKSSLVRACLHAYANRGLRLIEVEKSDLTDLPDLVDLVGGRSEKFIVFCDDLSFDEGEPGYKALKSVMDGSIAASTPNVLIYATSNRRHLLPEFMAENLTYSYTKDGEVHPGEGIEEKISLSDRFGLWISFYSFNQEEYLQIVRQWLSAFVVPEERIAASGPAALLWALERGSRSGRVAFQFAKNFAEE